MDVRAAASSPTRTTSFLSVIALLVGSILIPDSLLERLFGPLGLAILGGLIVVGGGAWFVRKRSSAPAADNEA